MPLRRESIWTEQEMFYNLVAMAQDRHEKSKHTLVDDFPPLRSLTEDTILGSFSWYGMKTKNRILHRANVIPVGEYASTPGDVARDYLTTKYPKRRPITGEQKAEIMRPRTHPLKAIAGFYPDAVYLDIRAAFWSIMSVVGWDVDYHPGKWIVAGEQMNDFPYADHKLARNVLVTAGLFGKIKVWSYERQNIFHRDGGNRLVNYQIHSLIYDVLNGVYHDMQEISLYAHTDGYIVNQADEETARGIFEKWGLPCGRKNAGWCHIHSAGQYRFNSPSFSDFVGSPKSMVGVSHMADPDWLRPRFKILSQLASPPLPPSK